MCGESSDEYVSFEMVDFDERHLEFGGYFEGLFDADLETETKSRSRGYSDSAEIGNMRKCFQHSVYSLVDV